MGLPIEWEIIVVFIARSVRMFSYGAIAVIFLIYLKAEFPPQDIMGILCGILLGDLIVSLALTSNADKYGRRLFLIIASALFSLLGITFYFTSNPILVALAGVIGIVSPAAGEIGPFISIEQAILSDIINARKKVEQQQPQQTSADGTRVATVSLVPLTNLIAWYQVFGSIWSAAGALICGFTIHGLTTSDLGITERGSFRIVYLAYAVVGAILAVCYLILPDTVERPKAKPAAAPTAVTSVNTPAAEVAPEDRFLCNALSIVGLKRPSTQRTVISISMLFSLDAFAGGLVIQSYFSWWFHDRWGFDPRWLGFVIMGINVIAGFSGLLAGRLVNKFGALNTMVFTHFPSNIVMMLVVAMPNGWSAVIMLLLRYTISQMDVPARQAYVAAVVPSDERAAGNGLTNSIRSLGVALSSLVLIPCIASSNPWWRAAPFLISGGLKCIYDVLVYITFPKVKDAPAAPPAPAPTTAAEASAAPATNEKSSLLINK